MSCSVTHSRQGLGRRRRSWANTLISPGVSREEFTNDQGLRKDCCAEDGYRLVVYGFV